ncbi:MULTISPECIES: hypothetical protein [unclassified Marinimicrobium]|jgi:hypothetical protein|uniref:hypothetical protein n=1 Tax=unclassified Marinimicrobium TaxID=2632100 RepID=UPI00257ACC43|nr:MULTISPECIES: hypothetical protein [unclassified Marinimicrobium]|tara:strand:+ start:170 stop:1027 length:858 start_codon:yes stop_codon:yes gene_type:complete
MANSDFCFCTLAIGLEYRLAALFLANDIKNKAPNTPLVVLTDDHTTFSGYSNILAIPFKSDSIFGCYHDKRYVIAQALLRFQSCCYLDADCRLFRAPPIQSLSKSFDTIRAWNVISFLPRFEKEKTYEEERGVQRFNSCERRLTLQEQVAKSLGVDLGNTQFLSEVCMFFTFSKRTSQFLYDWDRIARKLQLKGYGWGEGETIGICAAKHEWNVTEMNCSHWLFKDNLSPIVSEEASDFHEVRKILSKLSSKRGKLHKLSNKIVGIHRFLSKRNRSLIFKIKESA